MFQDSYITVHMSIIPFKKWMSLNESKIDYYKAWVKGSKIIAWIPVGIIGDPFHLAKVIDSPKQFGFSQDDIEKNMTDDPEDIREGRLDEDLEEFVINSGWVKVYVEVHHTTGIVIGSIRGKSAAVSHSAVSTLMRKDIRFTEMTLNYPVDYFQIADHGVIKSTDDWMRYLQTGRIPKTRSRSGVAAFR